MRCARIAKSTERNKLHKRFRSNTMVNDCRCADTKSAPFPGEVTTPTIIPRSSTTSKLCAAQTFRPVASFRPRLRALSGLDFKMQNYSNDYANSGAVFAPSAANSILSSKTSRCNRTIPSRDGELRPDRISIGAQSCRRNSFCHGLRG